MMLNMNRFLMMLVFTWAISLGVRSAHAQTFYEIQIDSIIAFPETVQDGETVSFYITVSVQNTPLWYQGNVYLELEYAGNFYLVDSVVMPQSIVLSPSYPYPIHATHRFSSDDDLMIGDNVVVVWPRIGNGVEPEQTVLNPYETIVTLVEPNGIGAEDSKRIQRSFITPNPAITSIAISLKPDIKIERSIVYDLTGKVLAEGEQERQMDISYLPAGIYFVDVLTERGYVYSDKLLITR